MRLLICTLVRTKSSIEKGTRMKKIVGCVALCILAGCTGAKRMEEAQRSLANVAQQINTDFANVQKKTSQLAKETQLLYAESSIANVLSSVDPSIYSLSDTGVFYKPNDDGGSAVFVSGCIPVNDAIKRIVYFTTPLDALFRQIIAKNDEVVQVYYNDKHSYNRIYPFFDVLMQYEHGMVIPDFNFYYLADAKHNPARTAVWVNEPYVDPAGRGWMVSAIAPVYVKDQLEGVVGLDITINTITDQYVATEKNPVLIFDQKGLVVSIDDSLTHLFSLPPLKDHRYLETIKADTFKPDQYNLLKSKSPKVRQLITTIIEQKQGRFDLEEDATHYTLLAEPIPSLNWIILSASTL